MQALAHLVGQRADLQQVRVLVAARRRPRATAARRRAPCRGSGEATLTRSPPRSVPSASRSQGTRPAPRISVAASLRVSAGLLALAPRRSARSATIGREQLVGAEAERHLRQARPQRGRRRPARARTRGQRQPAEREAAQRVEAVGLAAGRRHDAPERRRGRRERGQPLEPLARRSRRCGTATRSRTRSPACGRARAPTSAPRDQQVDARGARRGQPPSAARSASST